MFIHISSSWVEISFYTEFQLSRLPESRTASFRLNPIYCGEVPRLPGSRTVIFGLIPPASTDAESPSYSVIVIVIGGYPPPPGWSNTKLFPVFLLLKASLRIA